MESLYATSVTATGGRNGRVKSADGVLDADIRLPRSLGGSGGDFLNPETFFAAGYAACFDNALNHIMRMEKVQANTAVTAEVELLKADNVFKLAVKLIIEIPGIENTRAEGLVQKAHQMCPYSNAIRGNIDVQLIIK